MTWASDATPTKQKNIFRSELFSFFGQCLLEEAGRLVVVLVIPSKAQGNLHMGNATITLNSRQWASVIHLNGSFVCPPPRLAVRCQITEYFLTSGVPAVQERYLLGNIADFQ